MGMHYGWIPPRSRKVPKAPAFKPMKATAIATNPRMTEYKAMMEKCPSVGDAVGNASVVSITDPMQLNKEKPAVRKSILEKSKRLAPLYNKGPVQYMDDSTDFTTVGRKI